MAADVYFVALLIALVFVLGYYFGFCHKVDSSVAATCGECAESSCPECDAGQFYEAVVERVCADVVNDLEGARPESRIVGWVGR